MEPIVWISGKLHLYTTDNAGLIRIPNFSAILAPGRYTIREHYADIDPIGKRKYYVKRVYSKKQKEEIHEMEIDSLRDKPKK